MSHENISDWYNSLKQELEGNGLSIEKVRMKLSKTLASSDYDAYYNASIQSVEKGLKKIYS